MSQRRFRKPFLVLWPLDKYDGFFLLMKNSLHLYIFIFQEFDEDELEAELDALLEEQEEPAKAKKEEEDPDMAELAAWAS